MSRLDDIKARVEAATPRAEVAGLERQLEGQQAANTALLARIAELELLAHPWAAIHAKLDQLLARPIGPAMPTHRRIADGGVGGKRERKGRAA